MTARHFDEARLVNLANTLTALRVLAVPLFAYYLIGGLPRHAFAIFVLCGLTDALDGLVARILKQRTIVGFYLDPIADKILVATAFVVLAYVKTAPTWLAVLVISRDIFILVGSLLLLVLMTSDEIRPTFVSKANTAVQVLTVVYFLAMEAFPAVVSRTAAFGDVPVSIMVILLCAITTSVSGAQYIVRGFRALAKAPDNR